MLYYKNAWNMPRNRGNYKRKTEQRGKVTGKIIVSCGRRLGVMAEPG
jgi:hypothetical protein